MQEWMFTGQEKQIDGMTAKEVRQNTETFWFIPIAEKHANFKEKYPGHKKTKDVTSKKVGQIVAVVHILDADNNVVAVGFGGAKATRDNAVALALSRAHNDAYAELGIGVGSDIQDLPEEEKSPAKMAL